MARSGVVLSVSALVLSLGCGLSALSRESAGDSLSFFCPSLSRWIDLSLKMNERMNANGRTEYYTYSCTPRVLHT